MNTKFVPNLFLEVIELNRFKQSLDEEGFRKNILENSESFGLIQNKKSDPQFLNGRVARDFDDTLGNKTIKISPLFAIDKNGQFIYQEQKNAITIPNDGNWYWIKQRHTYSSIEVGTFSISANGDLVGSVTAKLTEILRGQPNFPSRVRFVNSTYNTLEYDVLELIDDQNAVLQHPSLTSGGESAFVPETDLKLEVIGTFTPGIAIPSQDKRPFQYDSATLTLVVETVNNLRPTHIPDLDFFLARCCVQGADLIVQDKRVDYWQTKGSQQGIDIERKDNPLIGVEAIKWNSRLTPGDTNILELAWGMRSQNWSVDSSQNLVTLQGSATGGKYKSVDDFRNGDFNGWRVYTDNGKYSRVISSIKQGSAINLTVDVLDVDNYSGDGGISFTGTTSVLVVPDCDTVIIKCIPSAPNKQEFMTREVEFPVNTQLAKLELVAYLDPQCFYAIHYRYQSYKEFTSFKVIPSDEIGYYTETSFTSTGNLKPSLTDRIRYPYDSITLVGEGFIQLIMSPAAYSRTISFINKGDLIGVNTIATLPASLYDIEVGISKNYQHIIGTYSLTNDVRFNLLKNGAIEGNEFRFHFEATALTLGNKNIYFSQLNSSGTGQDIIKIITRRDVSQMLNQEHGIVFTFKFDGTEWIMSQNYDLKAPGEIITLDGIITDLFDSFGWGKVPGLFGVALCDSRNGTPDLVDRFILGAGVSGSTTVGVGANGGNKQTILDITNLPQITPRVAASNDDNGNNGPFIITSNTGAYGQINIIPFGGDADGNAVAFSNIPPYWALIYAKRLY